MKVLLLGGTGVMGNYMVQLLNDAAITTVVTSRSDRRNFGQITYVKGNAKDVKFLSEICRQVEKWDTIIDFMSYKTEEFAQRIDILCSATNQYLFMSSARVYGDEEHPIKESSPRLLDCSNDLDFLKTDEYALTKARQENLLIKSKWENYTIIRPCITYGIQRLQLGVLEKEEWLFRALNKKTIVFDAKIANRVTTMTYGRDMAKAIFSLIGNKKANGICINLTTNRLIKWKEVWQIYKLTLKDFLGYEPSIIYVDTNTFLKTRTEELKYQVLYDRVYDRDYDTSLEQNFIDVDKFTQPEEGLKLCLKEFITGRHSFKYINWANEAKKDKLTHEHTSFLRIPGTKNKVLYILYRYFK